MPEFRIKWQECPHFQHRQHVLFIEAPDPETAKAVAKDHIERTTGIEWYTIWSVEPYLRPQSGHVSTSGA
jgi:hypothetical protein